MSTRTEYISAILANPSDDVLRLEYADWLTTNGEPVPAAFIRVQCQLAQLDPNDPQAEQLRRKESRLLWEGSDQIYATLLLAHLHALGFRVGGYDFDLSAHFDRGLIAALDIYGGEGGAKRFVEAATHVLAHDPVTRLTFLPVSVFGIQSSFTPDICYRATTTPISAESIGALLQIDAIGQLRELDLSGNPLDEEAVQLLTSSRALTELQVLRVGTGKHYCDSYSEDTFALPAELSASARSRLRERFGVRVVFNS